MKTGKRRRKLRVAKRSPDFFEKAMMRGFDRVADLWFKENSAADGLLRWASRESKHVKRKIRRGYVVARKGDVVRFARLEGRTDSPSAVSD